MFLIDTNVISEMRKKDRANSGVTGFFRGCARDDTDIYLSAVTVGELRRGIEIVSYRGDSAQATALERWIDLVLRDFHERVLPLDAEIAQVWGRLRVPHPENELDKMIAATALIHDLTVVTRNVSDFVSTGVRLLNPFT